MGVSIYVMREDNSQYSDGVDFAYSGLQRLRQMAILATISYLTEKLNQLVKGKESKQKKAKIECEDNNDNENNSDENSENEDETPEYQLEKIIDHLKTWTTTKKAEPISFDSTKNSMFDLLGQFQQMMPVKYDNVRLNYNEEYFARHNLCGLWKFVNHSDCDGVHSYGDCVDIHELFTNIIPYLNESEENKEWFESVDYVFQMAVEYKKGIRYS